MLEWFEMNREALKSQGFVIHQLLSNSEAYWIEPSAFIDFQTPFFVGELEMTIDGRCWYHLLPRDSSASEIIQRFLCLEPAAIEYREAHQYSGNMKDVNLEPRYEIREVSDYDRILEPMIPQALHQFPQGESNANI